MDNSPANIESFNRRFQIGEKKRDAVECRWNQEAGDTMFHLVNAYTRAAQFEGLPAEASYRLKKEGAHRVICDYIAGMTDRYALDEYNKFFAPYERV